MDKCPRDTVCDRDDDIALFEWTTARDDTRGHVLDNGRCNGCYEVSVGKQCGPVFDGYICHAVGDALETGRLLDNVTGGGGYVTGLRTSCASLLLFGVDFAPAVTHVVVCASLKS